jgi:hypothetical protein
MARLTDETNQINGYERSQRAATISAVGRSRCTVEVARYEGKYDLPFCASKCILRLLLSTSVSCGFPWARLEACVGGKQPATSSPTYDRPHGPLSGSGSPDSPSFDEYKLFVENTQHLSERRQTATQTFMAVNTATFAVLAFLVKDAGFKGWGFVLVSLPLFAVGLVSCLLWHQVIAQFRLLSSWRYEQLRIIERSLPGTHRLLSKEWDAVYDKDRSHFGFSSSEIWLP